MYKQIIVLNCKECPYFCFRTVSMVLKAEDAGPYCTYEKKDRKLVLGNSIDFDRFCELSDLIA